MRGIMTTGTLVKIQVGNRLEEVPVLEYDEDNDVEELWDER